MCDTALIQCSTNITTSSDQPFMVTSYRGIAVSRALAKSYNIKNSQLSWFDYKVFADSAFPVWAVAAIDDVTHTWT